MLDSIVFECVVRTMLSLLFGACLLWNFPMVAGDSSSPHRRLVGFLFLPQFPDLFPAGVCSLSPSHLLSLLPQLLSSLLLPASNNDCDIDANVNPEPATEAVQVDVRPGHQPLPVPVDAVGILGVAVAATLAHRLVARRSGWLGGEGVAAHAYDGGRAGLASPASPGPS